MSKQSKPTTDTTDTPKPTTDRADPDDKLGRLLETAQRMDANIEELTLKMARLTADFEIAMGIEAIENARIRAVGLEAPYRFLANQQPRIDGDHKPWEPHGQQSQHQARNLQSPRRD